MRKHSTSIIGNVTRIFTSLQLSLSAPYRLPTRSRFYSTLFFFTTVCCFFVINTFAGKVAGDSHALGYTVDFGVYYYGPIELLHSPLADFAYDGSLRFTYTVFAAIVLWPLHLLQRSLAEYIWLAASMTAAFYSIRIVLHKCGNRSLNACFLWSGLLFWFFPWIINFVHGQVNAFLFFIIFFSVFCLRSRFRGFWIGLAAGFKIYPIIVCGYFLIRRQWRDFFAVMCGGAFTIILSVIFSYHDTWQFFTSSLAHPSRIGNKSSLVNYSLTGLIDQYLPSTTMTAALTTIVKLLVFCYIAYLSWLNRGHSFLCLWAWLLIWVLLSPIAWGHHWIGVCTIVVYLFHFPGTSPQQRLFSALILLIWAIFGFIIWPMTPFSTFVLIVLSLCTLLWLHLTHSKNTAPIRPSPLMWQDISQWIRSRNLV